jgi:hypothetical protein
MTIDELISEIVDIEAELQEEMALLGTGARAKAKRLVRMSQEIERRPGGRDAMRPLLEHANPAVRCHAGYLVLPIDPDTALPIIREVAGGSYRVASIRSNTMLRRWEAGEIGTLANRP